MSDCLVEIGEKNGRFGCNCFDNVKEIWRLAQERKLSLSDFGKAERWPDVLIIFKGLENTLRNIDRSVFVDSLKPQIHYPQSLLQQTRGLTYLINDLVNERNYFSDCHLDKELILKSAIINSSVSSLVKSDLWHNQKNPENDYQKFLVFKGYVEGLLKSELIKGDDVPLLHQIFLLPYCLDNNLYLQDSDSEDGKLISILKENFWPEVLVFKFIKSLENIFFAEDQYIKFKNELLIKSVIKIELPKIEQLYQKYPKFFESLWPAKAAEYYQQFLEQN